MYSIDVCFDFLCTVNFQSYPTFDSEFSDRRAAINPAGHIGSDEEPADDRHQPPLGKSEHHMLHACCPLNHKMFHFTLCVKYICTTSYSNLSQSKLR